jgi:hypothetical protein
MSGERSSEVYQRDRSPLVGNVETQSGRWLGAVPRAVHSHFSHNKKRGKAFVRKFGLPGVALAAYRRSSRWPRGNVIPPWDYVWSRQPNVALDDDMPGVKDLGFGQPRGRSDARFSRDQQRRPSRRLF